jgi:hypothetical protein
MTGGHPSTKIKPSPSVPAPCDYSRACAVGCGRAGADAVTSFAEPGSRLRSPTVQRTGCSVLPRPGVRPTSACHRAGPYPLSPIGLLTGRRHRKRLARRRPRSPRPQSVSPLFNEQWLRRVKSRPIRIADFVDHDRSAPSTSHRRNLPRGIRRLAVPAGPATIGRPSHCCRPSA